MNDTGTTAAKLTPTDDDASRAGSPPSATSASLSDRATSDAAKPVRRPRGPRSLPPGWRRVWIPFRGWRVVGPEHRQFVDDFFRTPMMVLALLVLPLLVLEHYAEETLTTVPWLGHAVLAGLSLIWLAFFVEFVVKVTIAESRWTYVYTNWLDVIVLVLPFLRLLRAVRAIKALAVLRLAQTFTLRGVFLKLARSVAGVIFGVEVIRRWTGAPIERPDEETKERARLERLSRSKLIREALRLQREKRELERRLLEAITDLPARVPNPSADSKPPPGPDGEPPPRGA
ncbi:MAG: hypothetical protein FLDDKLPJ_03521 [Phycisphaerae bacterium]|nr:hypothetical protein [Phycisphaerae bacterium]